MMVASLTGQTLGTYRVLAKIGQGAMGVVYVGEHVLIGRKVAIKVLLPAVTRDPTLIRRFFNEARASAQIRHAGIVDVLDFGTTGDGTAYLVMEYLEGESLRDRLNRVGALPEATVRRLGRQVARALAAAHAQHIIHRDLKPDNLFLVPDDNVIGGERAKVLDFGVAKLLAEPVHGVETASGAILGSPAYMAPEQAGGNVPIDERTDVYALGCVLFEMLCGRRPFMVPGFAEMLSMHMFTPPPSPRQFAPGITASLDALIVRMLAKQPAARPGSMEDLAAALDEASDASALEPGADADTLGTTLPHPRLPPAISAGRDSSPVGRAPPVPRRSRRYSVVAGVALVAAVSAIFVVVAQLGTVTEQTEQTGKPTPVGYLDAGNALPVPDTSHAGTHAGTAVFPPDGGPGPPPEAELPALPRRSNTPRRARPPRPKVVRGGVIDE